MKAETYFVRLNPPVYTYQSAASLKCASHWPGIAARVDFTKVMRVIFDTQHKETAANDR